MVVALFILLAFLLVALPPLIASIFFDFVRKDDDGYEQANIGRLKYSKHSRFHNQEIQSSRFKNRFNRI